MEGSKERIQPELGLPAGEEGEGVRAYEKTPFDVLPEIKLSPEPYKGGPFSRGPFPKGTPGETRMGHSFYELRKDPKTGELIAAYITSRIGEKPILEAMTEEGFKKWRNKNVIARPAKFIWQEEKGMWRIEDQIERQ